MNKYQDAKNYINKILENPKWSRVDIEWQAIDEIKELLDKETPAKPIPCFTTHQTIKWWACPRCNTEMLFENQGCRNNDCRQKIKWSNDNEL